MGIFDKVCSAEMMLQYPKLYSPSQNGEHLNVRVFWGWIIVAIIHSVILYWLPMLMCQHDVLWGNGLDQSYLVLGNFVYTVSISRFYNFSSCPLLVHYRCSDPHCFLSVYCGYCLSQSWFGYKFMDMVNTCCYLGINSYMVFVCCDLQVNMIFMLFIQWSEK